MWQRRGAQRLGKEGPMKLEGCEFEAKPSVLRQVQKGQPDAVVALGLLCLGDSGSFRG